MEERVALLQDVQHYNPTKQQAKKSLRFQGLTGTTRGPMSSVLLEMPAASFVSCSFLEGTRGVAVLADVPLQSCFGGP